ncbi:MAG: hypothetical protein ACP5JG_18990 [Anaerolineae bacterium]
MSVMWQRQTHGVPRRRQKVDRMVAALFLGVTLAVTLLLGAYLALVASTVHRAHEIWRLHDHMAEIRRRNSQIKSDIARLSSIPVLQERSVALGYQPAESIEYVIVGGP